MKSFAILLLLVTAIPAYSQQLPFKPLPTVRVQLTDGTRKWYEELTVSRRTADRKFWFSTLVSGAFMAADVENSLHVLNQPGAQEANPIFGKHPSRATYYSIAGPVFILNAILSYHYKRQDDALQDASIAGHKYAKWWVPNSLNTAGHAISLFVTLAATGK